MRKIVLFVGIQFLFILKLYANADSTGIKYVNGKLFVLHKVEKGQGLYSIARRYGTTVPKIQDANPDMKTNISIGEIILVPYSKYSKTPVTTIETKEGAKKPQKTGGKQSENSADKEPIYHVVTKKETIKQIADNHKITEDQLKKWNNNLDQGLKIGEKVIVGYKTKHSAEKPIAVPKTDPTTETTNPPTKTKTKPKKPVEKEEQETEKKPGSGNKKEITENGMGSWVDDGSIKGEVNLAMHKTAPVGTIIRLKNPMNGKIKYVKVVGELPKTEENENLLIKIGKNTADELDIRDKNFRVEMTYSIDQ